MYSTYIFSSNKITKVPVIILPISYSIRIGYMHCSRKPRTSLIKTYILSGLELIWKEEMWRIPYLLHISDTIFSSIQDLIINTKGIIIVDRRDPAR